MTLDDFVLSPTTAPAVAAVRACIAPGSNARGVLLFGPPGVGKTHLLRGAAAHVRAAKPRGSVEVLGASEVVDRLIERDSTLRRPRCGSLLAIDDLHLLAGRPRTQVEVARLVDEHLRAGARVVLVGGLRTDSVRDLLRTLPETVQVVGVPALRPSDIRLVLAGVGIAELKLRDRASHGARGDIRRALGMVRTIGFGSITRV